MSALLDEIIADRKAKAVEYEDYLKRIAELAKRVEAGQADDTPEPLKKSPALRAIYNNLNTKVSGHPVNEEAGSAYSVAGERESLERALKIDETVRRVKPDDFRGHHAKEMVIKKELFDVLGDADEVERLFLIIKAQKEY